MSYIDREITLFPSGYVGSGVAGDIYLNKWFYCYNIVTQSLPVGDRVRYRTGIGRTIALFKFSIEAIENGMENND